MVNINGVYRNEEAFASMNGVWRKVNSYVDMHGVWRQTNSSIAVQEDDIIGFHFVYRLNQFAQYPLFSELIYHNGIRKVIAIGGEHPNEMTYDRKSIIFEYHNDMPYIEGSIRYDGSLYMELSNHSLILISDNSIMHDYDHLDVKINGYTLHETYGHTFGWNDVFSKLNNLPNDTNYSKSLNRFIDYYILPITKRPDTFYTFSQIGIARNVTNQNQNMVGSYGSFDHTIESVFMNGKQMPFIIEVYG